MNKILKLLVLMSLTLLFTLNLYASESIEVESKITEVNIYVDSALVTRSVSLKLQTGNYQIVFPDIIPDINESSIKVNAKGSAGIKLFGSQVKKEYLEEFPSKNISHLKAEIQKLKDEIKEVQNKKIYLQKKKDF